MKKTVCIDFDGVLHSYASGWQGIDTIPDPPVPGAMEWLCGLVSCGRYDVCVYSARSSSMLGISAMQNWLEQHMDNVFVVARVRFPTQKPPAHLYIDDRAFCFKGTFPSMQEIDEFRPWFKK